MANTFDYSGTKKVVTIVNKLPESEKVFLDDFIADGKVDIDAGTLQHAQILELEANETTPDGKEHLKGEKYFIRTNARMVQLYRVNQWVVLNGGDTLKVKVETGEEAAYFDSLDKNVFEITIA